MEKSGLAPIASACSRLVRTMAVAPSLIPHAFPAVTLPPLRNTVGAWRAPPCRVGARGLVDFEHDLFRRFVAGITKGVISS